MSYSITQLKSDVNGILHGTTTNKVTSIDSVISRAARDVLLDVDPQETKRTQAIGLVFNTIYDYSLPSDIKGNKVIDIFPQANRSASDVDLQTYNQNFDLTKAGLQGGFTIQFNTAVKSLRLNQPFFPAPAVLDTCEDASEWTAGGNASSVADDSTTFATGNGSISFNLSAGANPSTGYIEADIQSIDISSLLNQGYLFLWTYLPTGSDFSNVNLRWGSSSSAYYSVNATVTQTNTAFQNGWNLLSFAWNGASVTGSPDPENIDYVRVTWTYNGTAQTAVRLDQITCILGQILNMEYYSKFMFRTSGGTFQETVTDDSNLVNLDTESYDLLLYKAADLIMQQVQGRDALQYDGKYFMDKYTEAKKRYVGMYKSEVQVPQLPYYNVTKPNQLLFPRVRRGF